MGNSATEQADSPNGSHQNVAVIAAPVAIGTVLVLMVLLFCYWCKRRKTFSRSFHRRNQSDDTEMSNFSDNAPEKSKIASQPRNKSPTQVPGMQPIIEEAIESQPWYVGPTPADGTLAGFSPHSPNGSPLRSHPPPRHPNRRADSPTMFLPKPMEPLDVTRSARRAGTARGSVSAHQHTTIDDGTHWPLPPTRLPPPNGQGFAGPSMPTVVIVRNEVDPDSNGIGDQGQSPFDDNANDSASDSSFSFIDKRPRSSMLTVPETRKINDDGISEMSVSSRSSNRQSRLHHRASDEISVVSSLGEHDESRRPHDAREGGGSFTALPQPGDSDN